MSVILFYLLIHLIGFGLLTTVIAATTIIERRIKKSATHAEAKTLAATSSSIGLLSPVSVVIMLITGLGLMSMYGYGIFTHGWLTGKLLIFLIMALYGGYASVNIGKKRRQIYEKLIKGEDNPKLPGELLRLHNRQYQFIMIQALFLLLILWLTIFRPG